MVCFLCGEGFSKNPFLAFLGNVFTRQDDLDSKLHDKKSTQNVLPEGQFRPKIFYAPNDSNVTGDIIRRANRTFAAIGDFGDAMDKAINCSEEVVRRIPPNSPQARNLDSVSAEDLGTLLTEVEPHYKGVERAREIIPV